MPFAASVSARRTSSWKCVLPPSMIVSPGATSALSSAMVDSVGAPAGTMTHTARGASSAVMTSRRPGAPVAPAAWARVTASARRSYATTWWPPRWRRVTMLRPILPSPTKPSCIVWFRIPSMSQPREQRVADLADQHAIGSWQMHVQGAPAGRLERREIAEGLRQFERAERKGLSGNRDVLTRSRREQHEHAAVGSAFVQLAGCVQVARPVAEHRRGVRAIPDRAAKRLQFRGELRAVADVRQQAEV